MVWNHIFNHLMVLVTPIGGLWMSGCLGLGP